MRILGMDFTSAPRPPKCITLAEGDLADGVLTIKQVCGFPSFEGFEKALSSAGPWVAGIDFPFGQPRKLIEALQWPKGWTAYVDHVHDMDKDTFERTITAYSARQPSGRKRLKRTTDELAKSQSPMNIVNPPVGKMFFQGAPRIRDSGASIVPCAPNGGSRVIVEAYPTLVAVALAGTKHYKNDNTDTRADRRKARSRIVSGLSGQPCCTHYGLTVRLDQTTRTELINDRTADLLDAVLCAVQAAWSSGQPRYGTPTLCDTLEGWITDPALTTTRRGESR